MSAVLQGIAQYIWNHGKPLSTERFDRDQGSQGPSYRRELISRGWIKIDDDGMITPTRTCPKQHHDR